MAKLEPIEGIPGLGKPTKWWVGTKVPINVYEGDRPVCQCHTAVDAKRIVAAMNADGIFRMAHEEMHRYLSEIGDSNCEMCEAISRLV